MPDVPDLHTARKLQLLNLENARQTFRHRPVVDQLFQHIVDEGGVITLGRLIQRAVDIKPEQVRWFFNRLLRSQHAVELLPEPAYDSKFDLWYRPGTTDLTIVKNAKKYCKLELSPSDVFLDVGAHIGSVARHYAKQGLRVVAVEPEPTNYEILERNLGNFQLAELIKAAVVQVSQPSVKLYLSTGSINRGLPTLVPRKFSTPINVPTVQFGELLARCQPTAVKMDINGGEYDLLDTFRQLPTSVRHLLIEVHRLIPEHYQKFGPFIEWLEAEFELPKRPHFESGSFVFEVIAHRR